MQHRDDRTDRISYSFDHAMSLYAPTPGATVTPEPASMVLMASGLLSLALLGWRRRRPDESI